MLSNAQRDFITEISLSNVITFNSVAKKIDAAVNTLILDVDEISKEIFLNENAKKNFDSIAAAWVIDMSKKLPKRTYDDRNYLSCAGADVLCKDPQIAAWLNKKSDMVGKSILLCLVNQHRTLQQSFTSLCFRYIEMRWKEEGLTDYINYAEKTMGGYWWELPLI